MMQIVTSYSPFVALLSECDLDSPAMLRPYMEYLKFRSPPFRYNFGDFPADHWEYVSK